VARVVTRADARAGARLLAVRTFAAARDTGLPWRAGAVAVRAVLHIRGDVHAHPVAAREPGRAIERTACFGANLVQRAHRPAASAIVGIGGKVHAGAPTSFSALGADALAARARLAGSTRLTALTTIQIVPRSPSARAVAQLLPRRTVGGSRRAALPRRFRWRAAQSRSGVSAFFGAKLASAARESRRDDSGRRDRPNPRATPHPELRHPRGSRPQSALSGHAPAPHSKGRASARRSGTGASRVPI
jgi:hypothetical protein